MREIAESDRRRLICIKISNIKAEIFMLEAASFLELKDAQTQTAFYNKLDKAISYLDGATKIFKESKQ